MNTTYTTRGDVVDLPILQRMAWDIAENKGLHDNLKSLPIREATLIRLALVMTEVAEATQLVKRYGIAPPAPLAGDLGEELADILIRVGDLAQSLAIDLSEAVEKKMAKNRRRPQYYGTPEEEVMP